MPEGDTIHKIANYLRPRLAGRRIDRLEVSRRFGSGAVSGVTIRAVHAQGKHLYFLLDDDRALRTHLGMYGSWHRYAPDDPWKKPRQQASVILEADGNVYVCFNAKEVEWVRDSSVRDRLLATRLGPDLTAGDVDPKLVLARAREFLESDAPLADVLLDQRVACGVGNVYKSEVLFLRRHLPLTPQNALDDEALSACFSLASRLLGNNLGGGKRVTREEKDSAGRLWAYGRGGAPCLRCDGTIAYARLGRHHRGTYWCPGCQR